MKFVKHENFPDALANLIRHFEYWERGESTIQWPEDLYGKQVQPDEWFWVVGKQAWENRPVILTMDDGIKDNAVALKAMRESGCSFVFLERAWAKEVLQSMAWRILKVWPDIIATAESAKRARRQCRINVPVKGKINVTNL